MRQDEPPSTSLRYAMCGSSSYYDYHNIISIYVSHSASSITLKFTSNIDESPTNEAYGFNEIVITTFNAGGVYYDLTGSISSYSG